MNFLLALFSCVTKGQGGYTARTRSQGDPRTLDTQNQGKNNRLFEVLSNTRLTVFLCILLAVVSILGTLIPQNAPPAEYEARYGQAGTRILGALGLLDLYHSAGFVFLLSFLALNLAACTLKRFPNVWRALRRTRTAATDFTFKDWKNQETLHLRGQPREIEGELERVLPKFFGKPARLPALEGQVGIERFERNRFARLGPYIAHMSLVVILLGGLTGALFGFKGALTLREGEETSVAWLQEGGQKIELGFRIRCNRFVFEQYPNGSPKEYRSEVTLLDETGATIRDAAIRVNHPLSHKGIGFYQSTYGSSPELVLVAQHRESGETIEVRAELNRPFALPGGQGVRALALEFKENLVIPAEMARISSFSRENLGPAVRIVIFDEKGFQDPFWILKDFAELDRKRQSPYHFILSDFRLVPYTGLQVAKDPGAFLVWIGCTFLVIGFLISLLMDHEIVWVSREWCGEKELRVHLAGRAVRHPMGYAGRFERRKALLRKRLAPWLKAPQDAVAKDRRGKKVG